METERYARLISAYGGSVSCSSFVPIVETESVATGVGLEKGNAGCSSFVPIVETERSPLRVLMRSRSLVAAHSFRLWKLKEEIDADVLRVAGLLQLIRSDCGN